MADRHAPPRMGREEINACPIHSYDGMIHLVRTPEELAAALRLLEEETLLGFDTETRPSYHKGQSFPPALLQLAGEQAVFLFQLKHLGLPTGLRKILAEPRIIKAGVALAHDLSELRKLAPFAPAGFVDLGRLAREMGLKNHGLRGLAALLLGFRIAKSTRTSNWARDTLDPGQIRYAATDAWVGRELYLQMKGKDAGLRDCGPFFNADR